MKKILGYLLALIGIAGLAVTMIPQLAEKIILPKQLTAPIPQLYNTSLLTIVSVVLALVGILFIAKGGSKKSKTREVPIMAGKDVVGYRVIKGR